MRSRQLTQPIHVLPSRPVRLRPALARIDSFASVLAANAAPARSTGRTAWPAAPAVAVAGGGGEAVLAAATSQLGGRYVWGGTRPGAFDCSGLTQWAVRQATGQTIPRVAADQARAGRAVAREDLQPGDLVFFQNTYGPGITHVGVYAGDGRFVSAASEEKGIITSRMDDPYWSTRFAMARRVSG